MGIQGIAKQERNPIVYVTGFVAVYTILYAKHYTPYRLRMTLLT